MKTTLVLPEPLVARLREEAKRAGKSMSSVTEAALRRYLTEGPPGTEIPDLPVVSAGTPLVDLSDRDSLFEAVEGD